MKIWRDLISSLLWPFFMTIFLTRLTFVIFRHFTAGYKRPWKEDVTADFRHSSFIISAILSHINTNPVGEQQLHTVQYCSQAGETVGFPGWELTLGHPHTLIWQLINCEDNKLIGHRCSSAKLWNSFLREFLLKRCPVDGLHGNEAGERGQKVTSTYRNMKENSPKK